jgi:hypothetical protein
MKFHARTEPATLVRAVGVVVVFELGQDRAQAALPVDEQVVEALAAQGCRRIARRGR